MKKIEAILSVYGLDAVEKNLSTKIKDEEFFAWAIQGISKKELLNIYSLKEVLNIYYSGV